MTTDTHPIQAAVAARSNTPAKVSPKQAMSQLLEQNKGAIANSLPKGMTADRFSRLLLTAANTNPALLDCTPQSFLAAGVLSAQLGLEPNDARGLSYLLPYNDKKRGKIVQLIIGYRGMMELARRSGLVSTFHAVPVFDGDEFSYELGLRPTITHRPDPNGDEDPKKLTHVYAVATVRTPGSDSGDPQFVVLTRRQVEKARAQSMGGQSEYSPWAKWYVEMACKTALRRLCKMLPQTVEMAAALDSEERPLTSLDIGDLGYVRADDEDVIDTHEIGQGDAA